MLGFPGSSPVKSILVYTVVGATLMIQWCWKWFVQDLQVMNERLDSTIAVWCCNVKHFFSCIVEASFVAIVRAHGAFILVQLWCLQLMLTKYCKEPMTSACTIKKNASWLTKYFAVINKTICFDRNFFFHVICQIISEAKSQRRLQWSVSDRWRLWLADEARRDE